MIDITILPVDSQYFKKPNVHKFINIIYNNFYDIANQPKLRHNPNEIRRLLLSPKMRGFIAKKNNKIVGYLLGEINVLVDGRVIYFINYLYVGTEFRKSGIASRMMDVAKAVAKKIKTEFIVLNCDTKNKKVYDFYLKRGYMPDLVLRRYDRYEVLSLRL
jgi:ribosomal protein S18 acetylase RimI-like enzyme